MTLIWGVEPVHAPPLIFYNIKIVEFQAGGLWCLPVPGSQIFHAEACRESRGGGYMSLEHVRTQRVPLVPWLPSMPSMCKLTVNDEQHPQVAGEVGLGLPLACAVTPSRVSALLTIVSSPPCQGRQPLDRLY